MTTKEWLRRGRLADVELRAEKETIKISEARLVELCKIKREISECIHKVENAIYRTFLIEYYINSKTIQKVAEEMNYDERYIQKIHQKAISAVNEIRHKKTV